MSKTFREVHEHLEERVAKRYSMIMKRYPLGIINLNTKVLEKGCLGIVTINQILSNGDLVIKDFDGTRIIGFSDIELLLDKIRLLEDLS
jgi:hypothetical protein